MKSFFTIALSIIAVIISFLTFWFRADEHQYPKQAGDYLFTSDTTYYLTDGHDTLTRELHISEGFK